MSDIDVTLSAVLTKSEAKGGWTYIITDWTADYFGTRSRIKLRGTIDGHPFQTSLMALGAGTHKLPVSADIRTAIGKHAGDTVTVAFIERLT